MKILHSPTSSTAFDRFLIEARVLARLDHPNIIKVIAVEDELAGAVLDHGVRRRGLARRSGEAGRAAAGPGRRGPSRAGSGRGHRRRHVAGVLHRDLKPSNILLSALGSPDSGFEANGSPPHASSPNPDLCLRTPKVSDFGLAKRTDRDDGLTRTGPIGTPGYMSPEAAAGRYRDVAAPSDVYGLGATLYQLLTGQPPFTGQRSTRF